MGLIAAKCSECGAPIEVDDTRKFGYCPNCGTKYVTQDVIQNIQQNYYTINQNKIENAVFQSDTERTYFERFDAFRKLGQLVQAEDVAKEMREKFPQKAITWYCSLYFAYAFSIDTMIRCQENIASARKNWAFRFDTERGKKKIREDFRNFPGEAWKVEKILKSYIDGTKQDVMKEEIVIWPEEDMAISCEEYVGEMEKRSAVFESAADKEEYAPFLKLLEQEKEEYNRRREETYRAIRQYNADYMKACDEWERRIMSEFRKIKGGKTARKAVVWIIGLGIAAAVIVVIIAALATL